MYPSDNAVASRPTSHLPGTRAKLRLLRLRARLNLPLFHPRDAVLAERHGWIPEAMGGLFLPVALVEETPDGPVVVEEKPLPPARPVETRAKPANTPEQRAREAERKRRSRQRRQAEPATCT